MTLFFASFAEKTTNDVIDIFLNLGKRFIRYCKDSKETENFEEVDLFRILPNAFWYRKGVVSDSNKVELWKDINIYRNNESKIALEYLIANLEQKAHIGNYFQRIPNKLIHLSIAKKSGLCTPEWIMTTRKEKVYQFKKKHKSIINKSLRDSFKGTFGNTYYYNHTERVTNSHIERLNDSFFPTLFQEEIPKSYELRVIFVYDQIWTGAIISQNDPNTQVDWRNYNSKKPNRIIPYKLPTEIENKVRRFAKEAKLNTGAIDMIVTEDNRYIFLECNPNGQISMVSENCNYPIEKYIANFLASA